MNTIQKTCLALLFALLAATPALALTEYQDGGVHNITTNLNDNITVLNATTFNLLTGGQTLGLSINDTSQATIDGGTVNNGLNFSGSATGSILSGTMNSNFNTTNDATVSVSGGTFNDDWHITGNAIVTVSGSFNLAPGDYASDNAGNTILTGTLANGDAINVAVGYFGITPGTLRVVPEPSSLTLLGLGGLFAMRRTIRPARFNTQGVNS